MDGRDARGFTLIEVMVALVLMSVMAIVAWQGLDALLTSRDVSQQHLDQSTRLQSVLQQWELDLHALQDTTVTPPLSFDGATLRVTRQQATGIQIVVWSVRNGGLYRWEGPIVQTVAALQQSYQRSEQLQAQDSAQVRTLDGVAGWQMYYYRGNSWSNALSTGSGGVTVPIVPASPVSPASGASSPSSTGVPPPSGLPTGVRMLLQFDPASGFAGPLTRQIVLGPQA